MIYLAPNVYVLHYLMKTNQFTSANEGKAHRFIQYGTLRRNSVLMIRAYMIILPEFRLVYIVCP